MPSLSPPPGCPSTENCPTQITCPPYSELCDAFPADVPPSFQLYGLPAAINATSLDLVLDTANFAIGTDGYLALYINHVLHAKWDNASALPISNPLQNSFRRNLTIQGLPEGPALALVFQLKDMRGRLVATRTATLSVQHRAVRQWVSSVVAASSSYTEPTTENNRPAASVIGPNDLNSYQTSQRAWSPERGGSGAEYIIVKYDKAVYPRSMSIYESFAPGGTTAVFGLGPNGTYIPLWVGLQPDALSRALLPSSPDTIARTIPLLPLDFPIDTFKVAVTTPPWTEIDAILLTGDLTRVGGVTFDLGMDVEPIVPFGGTRNVTASLTYDGDATVYFSVAAADDWVEVYPAAGFLTQASPNVSILIRADASNVSLANGYRFASTVTVSNAVQGSVLATIPVRIAVEAAEPPPPFPNPVCYHGVLVPGTLSQAPVCQCEPGAYGLSCEFLNCPRNCTAGGVCDPRTGRCNCNDNYIGVDCSGHRGGCYLSYDGEQCLPLYSRGSYLINAEDNNNINRGVGTLPEVRGREGEQSLCIS